MPMLLQADALDLSELIRPGDTVLWGQANAEPLPLTQALMEQRARIGRFRVMLGIASSRTCGPEHADVVDFLAYCGAGANRELGNAGVLDILPSHYSQLPGLIASGALRIDVLMLQLAPADANGRYSLGIAHEYLLPALDHARVVIAEVNQQAPRTFGERTLGEEDLDAILHTDRPPLENPPARIREADTRIAAHIAELIDDGATLQIGIGAIPDAVLGALRAHQDLGVHSGSLGDSVAQLMQAGVITNACKSRDRHVSVGGVLLGSRVIHDYAHDNPAIQLRSTAYTHDADVLASLDRFVAINSAVEVDLTGQINSEVAAGSYVGAVGGALDFLRGAARAKGGLPIIALPSTAGSGSRIVARLNGPATIPRSDAGLIVTEFGVADLRGKTIRERVACMLEIAHPRHRAALEAQL
ncbi:MULTISPECIES: acetyl-CoA hydrolase/transferase family protein [Pseudomonas]|uniref:Acetyl-CoA hydrolase/transferase C-terminal domain-containing protein n=2 Tax=Pseudomonas TaxID=286 RepID=A0AAW6PEP5_9PSED|nr:MULTISPECIES: acetyl-CoA hydrolase/transferase C-terminal domain-containing protein [Pseudomonas]VEE48361.1 acetyl-CoA hydrolase/transferase [Pseudomonas fluorescens]KES20476.1 acetyl-CoA hydrolase [Pseudomonas sp. AAC]MBH3432247.1 acetyl-CoA hydrolase/transferase family protein [Pseudomonas citronellolis]MDF3845165.1 acetyl-CoA hydrolase/transferase C-terminal domain-containing protein [Pseudomonas citronellolis]HBN9857391.1 acetyl-CoA hydrolase/transferase family protein [Pseudomonas aeru